MTGTMIPRASFRRTPTRDRALPRTEAQRWAAAQYEPPEHPVPGTARQIDDRTIVFADGSRASKLPHGWVAVR